MYHGIVGPSGDGKTFCGSMHDKWGDSEIVDFQLNGNKLKFSKNYPDRSIIKYYFSKKDEENIWIGTYYGEDCEKGDSKCIITIIDESFLKP